MNSLVEVIPQYGPLFGILAAAATILGVAFTIYKDAHDRQVHQKDHEIETLKREGDKEFQILNEHLDLQGSLSSLFMSEPALLQRSKEKRLLQHYLLNVVEGYKANQALTEENRQ